MIKKNSLLLIALIVCICICLVANKVMAIAECTTNAECNSDVYKSKCVDNLCVGCADNLNTGEESSDCTQFDEKFCVKQIPESGSYCSDTKKEFSGTGRFGRLKAKISRFESEMVGKHNIETFKTRE